MGETREALFAALGAKSFWRWPAEGFELGSDSAKATLRGLQLHDFRTGLDRWLKVSAKCADRSTATRMAYFHGFSRGGSGYAPDFEGNESSDDEAAGVTCARPGCSKPPWNGAQGEYCGRSCRDSSTSAVPTAAAAGVTCARPGCSKPSWNGAQGEYCGKSCRDSSTSAAPTAAAAGVTCARPGCSKPSWNGAQGEYCGKSCRDSSTSAAPTAAAASQAGASCVPATQQQFDSVKQQFQKSWNTGSPPQIRAIFKIHASSAVATAYHSKCSSIGPMAAHGNGSKLANQQRRFHGTRQSCAFSGQPCTNPGCRACSIIRGGFQIKHLSANTQNRGAFGPGHYTSAKSSTAKGYGNVLIVTIVAVGITDVVQDPTSAPLPPGRHSRVANKSTGNDELMVPGDDQMLPSYLVLF
ncbi:unnamed protein product [Effrenium voratum]|uniref:PARP catalytic domain-containing protein n=1 Tax=Effrenium voratum TaxID=2562239 RepID=A0AA36J299_9DINO|nr:unnamed protein product [Effrenium voratum]